MGRWRRGLAVVHGVAEGAEGTDEAGGMLPRVMSPVAHFCGCGVRARGTERGRGFEYIGGEILK